MIAPLTQREQHRTFESFRSSSNDNIRRVEWLYSRELYYF